MTTKSLVFDSPEGEAHYLACYDEMLTRWPVQPDSLDVGTRFGITHVNVTGPQDSTPMVLLHAASVSSTEWYANIGELSREHRVYAIDTIGDAGKSIAEKLPESIFDFNDWLLDVFNGIGIQRPIVVGHSFGGWLAINWAIYHAERTESLILLAPAATIQPFYPMVNFALHLPHLLPHFLQPGAGTVLKHQAVLGFRHDPAFVELMDACLKYCHINLMFPTVLTDNELRSLTVRTLLLLGHGEKTYDPKEAANRARRLIPHIEVELIPRAGHTLNMEEPYWVNKRILEFLAQPVPITNGSSV